MTFAEVIATIPLISGIAALLPSNADIRNKGTTPLGVGRSVLVSEAAEPPWWLGERVSGEASNEVATRGAAKRSTRLGRDEVAPWGYLFKNRKKESGTPLVPLSRVTESDFVTA